MDHIVVFILFIIAIIGTITWMTASYSDIRNNEMGFCTFILSIFIILAYDSYSTSIRVENIAIENKDAVYEPTSGELKWINEEVRKKYQAYKIFKTI